jgi:hypothetical protein
LSPPRRRSLKDAARDPLTIKTKPKPQDSPARPKTAPRRGMPVVLKVAIGMLIGFTGGFVLGRFNRWI